MRVCKRRPNVEIGECDVISHNPSLPFYVFVEHISKAVEIFLSLGDLSRIRVSLTRYFHHPLVDQGVTCGSPVGELPALPTANIGLNL